MNDNRLRRWAAALLALLAAAQGLALVVGGRPALVASDPWLAAGDLLAPVAARDAAGRVRPLPSDGPTVLLVFDPRCGPCRAVAPLWEAWMRGPGTRLRVIALSAASPESAQAFASLNRWTAEVITVPPENLAGSPRGLTRRTPWVFVLDERGVISAEGHGQRLAELTAAVGLATEDLQ